MTDQPGDRRPESMLEGLPPEIAEAMRPLLAEPPLPHPALEDLVAALEGGYGDPRDVPRSVDLETALSLVDECRSLLARLGEHDRPDRRRVVQAAVRYVATEGDADDDLESVTGFDDDELVLTAARAYLERDPG